MSASVQEEDMSYKSWSNIGLLFLHTPAVTFYRRTNNISINLPDPGMTNPEKLSHMLDEPHVSQEWFIVLSFASI